MDTLLLRFLRGATTPEETDQVAAWLKGSPENEERLGAMRAILDLAAEGDARIPTGHPPSAAAIIDVAEERSLLPSPRRRSPSPAWVLAPIGLAAVVAAVTLGLQKWDRGSPADHGSDILAEELTTGAGESATVRMSDGTVVRLGPESRLQVMSGGSGRQVTLVGRAFFAVARNEDQPFKVFTPSGSVRVLGTRFQLEANVDDMRLVVVEGSVALATPGSEVEVGAGEMTEVKLGRPGAVQKAPALAQLSSEWMGQFLVFQKTPLATAVREIEALYDVEVEVQDPGLAEKTLTMWFSSRPLEDVLTVVCSVIDASCQISGQFVSIGTGQTDLGGGPGEGAPQSPAGEEGSS